MQITIIYLLTNFINIINIESVLVVNLSVHDNTLARALASLALYNVTVFEENRIRKRKYYPL